MNLSTESKELLETILKASWENNVAKPNRIVQSWENDGCEENWVKERYKEVSERRMKFQKLFDEMKKEVPTLSLQ